MQMTSFVLLGVPEQFRLDPAAVEAGWKKAIAAVHPDRFADRSAAERRVAEQWAGRINEARDALMTPVARATELLKLRGRDIKSETDTPFSCSRCSGGKPLKKRRVRPGTS